MKVPKGRQDLEVRSIESAENFGTMHFNEGTKLLDKLVLVQYVNDLSLANCDKTVYVLDSMHIAKRGNSLHLHPNFSCA